MNLRISRLFHSFQTSAHEPVSVGYTTVSRFLFGLVDLIKGQTNKKNPQEQLRQHSVKQEEAKLNHINEINKTWHSECVLHKSA